MVIIQNIVATFNCTINIDLEKIFLFLTNNLFQGITFKIPKKFNALIIKRQTPKITFLLFPSGKIVIVGSKAIKIAYENAYFCAGLLKKLYKNIKVDNFSVQNIVASKNMRNRKYIKNFNL